MKNKIIFLSLLVSSMCFTSCTSDDEIAKKTVSDFFTAVTASSSDSIISNFYPGFDSLHVDLKSDLLDFDKNINKNHDTLSIACQNSYTDKLGVFRQDSIKFYLIKIEGTKNMSIIDSEGLVKLSDELQEFAEQIGFRNLQKNRDSKLFILKSNIHLYYNYLLLVAFMELHSTGVTITKWDWETDYSGEPKGQAWIKNNTDITIKSIGYIIDYKDRENHLIYEDTGIACYELSPGEEYRFTFYTSHVKYPEKTYIRLEFNASTAKDYIMSKGLKKADFVEFCKLTGKQL